MNASQEAKFPLHEACREGKTQIAESLLSANPKLANVKDDDERLPIHWAVAYNRLPIVELLISSKHFDPDVEVCHYLNNKRRTTAELSLTCPQDGSGWTPLMIASSLKNAEGDPIIDLLLKKGADNALHFATSKANLSTVRTLIANKCSARVKDKRGQLPLHRAAAIGSSPIIKVLLEDGKSPVNATDVDGLTALHHAVSEGHGDAAITLLKAGAEADKRDSNGVLAIDMAPDSKVRSYILQTAEREGLEL
ncbi:hypothetical protein AbraCBS73388_000326 [Aspergillus brasiliensis]|uniref:Proteasome regulatory particle subunit n=1 Tax=Aspergillus brasiliensis TaxID=319629 RepID=A0A9W5YJF0_9EURO|nr:hypothetical protein AbraCBS73388_000326 [Aspergillus brasiliensis]